MVEERKTMNTHDAGGYLIPVTGFWRGGAA